MGILMNDEIRPAQNMDAASSDDRKAWETPTVEVISAREAEASTSTPGEASSTS